MTENIKKELFAAEFYALFHTKLENAPSKNELSEFLSGKIMDKNFLCALVLIGKISDWNHALLFKFSDDTKKFYNDFVKIFYHLNDPNFAISNFAADFPQTLDFVVSRLEKEKNTARCIKKFSESNLVK